MSVTQHAEEIHDQFSDQLDVSVDEIEERLDTLVNEYRRKRDGEPVVAPD